MSTHIWLVNKLNPHSSSYLKTFSSLIIFYSFNMLVIPQNARWPPSSQKEHFTKSGNCQQVRCFQPASPFILESSRLQWVTQTIQTPCYYILSPSLRVCNLLETQQRDVLLMYWSCLVIRIWSHPIAQPLVNIFSSPQPAVSKIVPLAFMLFVRIKSNHFCSSMSTYIIVYFFLVQSWKIVLF